MYVIGELGLVRFCEVVLRALYILESQSLMMTFLLSGSYEYGL